jgi:hypothetical protein
LATRSNIAIGALVAALLGGCDVGHTLEVRNVNAPTVHVLVNGTEVGVLPCRGEPLILVAGVNAPPLPWEMAFVLDNGDTKPSLSIDRTGNLPKVVAVLDEGVLELPPLDLQALAPFELIPCPAD